MKANGPDPSKFFHDLSDKDLYARCQEYGLNARVWKRRFAGLLPEVARRDLHRRRGYVSIYEFAFKLAGISGASVDKILSLARKLEDKPVLLEQLESGSQGWSKIEKVAFIATAETDREWAEKVEKMSSSGLAAYVEVRRRLDQDVEFTNSQNEFKFTAGGEEQNNSQTVQAWNTLSFTVAPDVEKQLRLFKYQMEKEQKRALSFNEFMALFLKKKAVSNEQIVMQVCPECAARKGREVKGRAVPTVVRRVIQAKYQGRCAFKGCLKPASSLHHTKRYALNPSHDPGGIVPLCTAHERLVHSGLIANEEAIPEEWQLLDRADPWQAKYAIDQKVQSYRKESRMVAQFLKSAAAP